MNTAYAYVRTLEETADDAAILAKVERRRAENLAARPQSVIAPKVLKCNLGFREASRLMKISGETEAVIRLTLGKRSATADSMLALLALGIKEGQAVVLTVKGGDTKRAFEESLDVLDGRVFG